MQTVQRQYERFIMKSVNDVAIMLECLHEVYGTEKEQLLSRGNIRNTMVYPFLKMIESQCGNLPPQRLHELLWKLFLETSDKEEFLTQAGELLQPHRSEKGPSE
ncbi:hypothetical protein CE91St62_39350 [Lachnospiraceae bacterium]|uniref:hypothetical protein n=1 Tax=Extibacter sp. GGCC_0201 TaxID=2731209 RepID=UPI001AA16C7A|nr:hypothetical protein [Extibacter sp. GGCC_0201]MBO1720702.1 hypothetical protein [Extibacter sp. GGCC_0201]BDF35873.1 hypothetical protein CE91St61_39480 [Lachnospiraceae bacterium]BDF39874.1 hypothetical protein CE91St62_39350 [Lachnospiraceae bacterium]